MTGSYHSIYLSEIQSQYVRDHLKPFGQWIKHKIEEEMSNDVELINKRIKDIDAEKQMLLGRIKLKGKKRKELLKNEQFKVYFDQFKNYTGRGDISGREQWFSTASTKRDLSKFGFTLPEFYEFAESIMEGK